MSIEFEATVGIARPAGPAPSGSGFVICMSCWGRSLGDFFTSWVTRLMPAYLFSVLPTGALLTVLPLSDILVNTTMLQQFRGVPNLANVY